MRVWFNHWFSTCYHLIDLIRAGDPGRYTFLGSNANASAVYSRVCDEWYREPDGLPETEYVEWCLGFCRERSVDVFVPRRGLIAAAAARERFEALGVRLFADRDAETMALLDDKPAAYRRFAALGFDCVPPFRVVRSVEEFDRALEELAGSAPRLCYKLTEDEGARSFRVIDDGILGRRGILEKPGFKVTRDAARAVLSTYDFSIPVMVMPYLSGREISADCLATPSGNLVIPRIKSGKRYSEVLFDPEIMALCGRFMDALGLKCPLNIQFREEGGRFWLLEINPRMSGGLQLSCLAAGVNLPSIAMHALLGETEPWQLPGIRSRRVANIETPVCLD